MTTDTSREAIKALIAEAQVIAWNPFPPMSNRDATLTERMQDTLAALLDERDAARDASVWRDTIDEQRAYIRDLEADRDAYKRAKAENDERFQIEAAEQRERADRLAAKLDAVKAFIANRSVIGGMDRMRLAAILADTDEGSEQ